MQYRGLGIESAISASGALSSVLSRDAIILLREAEAERLRVCTRVIILYSVPLLPCLPVTNAPCKILKVSNKCHELRITTAASNQGF
jgi:hypothetical protein